jgi:hypothetical protein
MAAWEAPGHGLAHFGADHLDSEFDAVPSDIGPVEAANGFDRITSERRGIARPFRYGMESPAQLVVSGSPGNPRATARSGTGDLVADQLTGYRASYSGRTVSVFMATLPAEGVG